MLSSLKELRNFKIHAVDGEIGKVSDFYFDDHTWTIRYLIADTGNWLISNKILLSPQSIKRTDWENKSLYLTLTKKQIEESPPVDRESQVTRKTEMDLAGYYGWPYYWTGLGEPVIGAIPPVPMYPTTAGKNDLFDKESEPNLKSLNEVEGYSIEASNGSIGHLEDFIAEDNKWEIRYLIVDTKNFLPGKKVIVALRWIKKIEWIESNVYVDLSKEKIISSPEYNSDQPVDREYEEELHSYYGKETYWK
jgi:hypothetical protein